MSTARGDMRKAKINVTEEQDSPRERFIPESHGHHWFNSDTRKGWKEGDGFPRRGHG